MANPINDKHKWQTGTKFMEAVRNLRSLPEVGMQGMAVGDLQLQGEERMEGMEKLSWMETGKTQADY